MTRISLVLALLISCVANAHHSVGVFYESDSFSEVSGTITRVDWVNPHIRFTVETFDDENAREVWEVEAGSVNMLERNGVRRELLEVGSQITVIGRPSRLGQQALYATSMRTQDGASVAFRGLFGEPEAAAAGLLAEQQGLAGSQAEGIFRVWTRGRAYAEEANDSPTGLALPYTPAAQAARQRYDPLTDDTALECIPQGMPGIMDNPFPIEFVAQGDDILLRLEEWDAERTIHMSGGGNPDAATPMGYSVGRWEEETLVVVTTRIDWPFFDDVGTPQSTDVETVERFWLSEGGNRLNYTITATDPATFTEPVTLDGYWVWVLGQEIKPYGCAR